MYFQTRLRSDSEMPATLDRDGYQLAQLQLPLTIKEVDDPSTEWHDIFNAEPQHQPTAEQTGRQPTGELSKACCGEVEPKLRALGLLGPGKVGHVIGARSKAGD